MKSANRRQFLAAAGLAGLGATVGAPVAADAARAETRDRVDFHGLHQAGISTPAQNYVQFVTLDLKSDAAGDLRAVLKTLSDAAARLTAGRTVGPTETGTAPPVDTGEALGHGPSRLTITFGLGPALFREGRLGLASRRPEPLVKLPAFAGDDLQGTISGGDIGIQICADDPQVTFHAAHDLIRLAAPTAVPRWSLAGFGRTLNSRGQATPRNLMGFKDGTANIMNSEHAALQRFVWAREPDSPAWMRGGSYMVVRRIQMLLANWDSISLDEQEKTFGRHKISGAPLGEHHEFSPLDLKARAHGHHRIPEHAHVRLASPQYNHGERILRRGYSYTDGIDHSGQTVGGGLLFICYQRDPRRQFTPIQRRLAGGDMLGEHIQHVGSAIFACPPGASAGGFVGDGLFS